MPHLTIAESRCIGCLLCQVACAYRHFGVFAAGRSRIKVEQITDGNFIKVNVRVCRFCRVKHCVNACSRGALHVVGDVVELDTSRCDRCYSCVVACPYGAISIDPTTGYPLICDLCDGDPECVKWCPVHAIEYIP